MRLVDPDLIAQMGEYVCAAALWFHRRFDDYARQQGENLWRPLPPPLTSKRRVGILGLGEIGQDVAAKLVALGFPVHGWSRRPKHLPQVTGYHGDGQLEAFLSQSNILVCLLPLTPATRGILNRDTFARLPAGAYLINVARGGHLVEDDLLEALAGGQIAGAALDVFNQEPLPPEHPFWQHPQIKITPHVAGLTRAETAAPQIAENLARLARGEPLLRRVDAGRGY